MSSERKKAKGRTVSMTIAEARRARRKRPLLLGEKTSEQLAMLRDDEIDYSDIPPLDERFFQLVRLLTPTKKRSMTLRIDEDIYQWLKSQGAGYQSRVNALLKATMLTQATMPKK